MSSVDILVPDLPESVADATVATWHKKPGDAVKRDEVLVEIETDKVVLEVPASADGILDAVLEESQGVLSPFFFPFGGFTLGKRSFGERLYSSSCQMREKKS